MLYSSFMDEKALERRGLAPLMEDIAAIRALSDKSAMARYMGATDGRFGISLMNSYVDTDTADPTINDLYIGQGGLGLPEKDYYLNANFAPQRQAYMDYMARTFKAIGTPDPVAAAAKAMEFETYAAQLSWGRRRPARHRQDQQPLFERRAGCLRARARLGCVVRRARRRAAAAPDREREHRRPAPRQAL